MQNFTWSAKEKRVARTSFESAALGEERELVEYFKIKCSTLKSLEDIRALQHEMQEADREYQNKYDFRYSQLITVFGRLVREGRLRLEDFEGLSEEKLGYIEKIARL